MFLLVCLSVFYCIRLSHSLYSWLFYCNFSFLLLSSGHSFIALNDLYNNFLSLWLLSLPFDSSDCFPLFSHPFLVSLFISPLHSVTISHLSCSFSMSLFSFFKTSLSFSQTYLHLCHFSPSGALCLIQTDHLSLEELHTTRLSCMPATEKCWRQEESAM